MKLKIAMIILIGISFGLQAQNVDLNNSTDYVRIQKNGESDFSRAFGLNSSNHMYIGSVEKTIGNIFFFNKGTDYLMTINPEGRVGIGTTNPSEKLEINGSFKTPSFLLSNVTGDLYMRRSGSGDPTFKRALVPTYSAQANISVLHLNYSGDFNGGIEIHGQKVKIRENLGIGTNATTAWRLAVNGKIRAKEIKVETDWSDFVFEKDYELPTLQEVENHIKEKGHLKDIPSAHEVQENGIFLGEMDSKLLQKIEELTLYTIQQEKKINQQQSELKKQEHEIAELKSLQKKLVELQNRLEKLEKE